MLRLTIITADTTDILTVSGLLAFMETFRIKDTPVGTVQIQELNRVFTLDPHFVNTFATIPAHVGFGEEERNKIHRHLKYRVGQKCIITTRWLSKANSDNARHWQSIVQAFNLNTPLQDTHLHLLYRNTIEYHHSTQFFTRIKP